MRERRWKDLPERERTAEAGYREAQIRIEEWLARPGYILNLTDLFLLELPPEIKQLGNTHISEVVKLNLGGNSLTDFSLLAGMKLHGLSLKNLGLSDLSTLKNISCGTLDLSDNDLRILEPLVSLDFSELLIDNNQFENLDFLVPAERVLKLSARDNAIKDISGLTQLVKLEHLNLERNRVEDISPLEGLRSLEDVDLGNNSISDVRPLAGLLKLRRLDLMNNPVKSVRPLKRLIRAGRKVTFEPFIWLDDTCINVHKCPLVDPPLPVAEKGGAAILEYFSQTPDPFSGASSAGAPPPVVRLSEENIEEITQLLSENNLEAALKRAVALLPRQSGLIGVQADLNAAEKDFIEGAILSEDYQRRISGIRQRFMKLLSLP